MAIIKQTDSQYDLEEPDICKKRKLNDGTQSVSKIENFVKSSEDEMSKEQNSVQSEQFELSAQ